MDWRGGTIMPGANVVACDQLERDDFYLVDAGTGEITAMRNGKAVKLEGAEKERVRRWLLRERAAPQKTETGRP